MAVAAAVRDEGERSTHVEIIRGKKLSAFGIQHSTLSFQRFAFDSIMQENESNRDTLARSVMLSSTKHHGGAEAHLVVRPLPRTRGG